MCWLDPPAARGNPSCCVRRGWGGGSSLCWGTTFLALFPKTDLLNWSSRRGLAGCDFLQPLKTNAYRNQKLMRSTGNTEHNSCLCVGTFPWAPVWWAVARQVWHAWCFCVCLRVQRLPSQALCQSSQPVSYSQTLSRGFFSQSICTIITGTLTSWLVW